jgi:hypothetical protein
MVEFWIALPVLWSLAAMYFIFYSRMMHCGKGTEDSILQREDGFEDVL